MASGRSGRLAATSSIVADSTDRWGPQWAGREVLVSWGAAPCALGRPYRRSEEECSCACIFNSNEAKYSGASRATAAKTARLSAPPNRPTPAGQVTVK
jgi:hypothetical protein